MDNDKTDQLLELVQSLDELIDHHIDFGPHNIAGVLLSRVTHLMTRDPSTGKGLVRYIWERLDEIEQEQLGDNFND